MKKSINVLIIPTLQISIPMKVEDVDVDLTTIFGSTETQEKMKTTSEIQRRDKKRKRRRKDDSCFKETANNGSQDRNRHREVPFLHEGQSSDQNRLGHITSKDKKEQNYEKSKKKSTKEENENKRKEATPDTFQPINEHIHDTMAPSI